jgi:hypothetical protein
VPLPTTWLNEGRWEDELDDRPKPKSVIDEI